MSQIAAYSPARTSKGSIDGWMVALPLVSLGLFVALPIALLVIRSLHDDSEAWIGLRNYHAYLTTPALFIAASNSLIVAFVSSSVAVVLASLVAFVVSRTHVPGRSALTHLMMLPMYAPTMLIGLALVYLFGRQGLVTRGFFGAIPGVDIGLYGLTGIILAETLLVLPAAMLVMNVAMRGIDGRLDDAARSIGASGLRRLRVVVLPAITFGLIASFLACFVTALTDFGAPKIVGGQTQVLPVQIYQQVVGQANLSMGATVAVFLLVPAGLCFILQQRLERRARSAGLDARATPARVRRNIPRDLGLSFFAMIIAGVLLCVLATSVFASLVNVWPWSIARPDAVDGPMFSLRHYFPTDSAVAGGMRSLFNSLGLALVSALVGTTFAFVGAYAVEKLRRQQLHRSLIRLLSLLPLAMPGIVVGLALLLLFNRPTLIGLPNPTGPLYGSYAAIVIANVVHFMGMAFLTTTASLKQQSPVFEESAQSMGVSRLRLLGRVTVPLSAPALIDVGVYLFVNAMTTVSAVIFLYSPTTITASVAVVALDDAGEQQAATALCVAITFINIVVALLGGWIKRRLLRNPHRN
jgi:iron(III) transport system permease protein